MRCFCFHFAGVKNRPFASRVSFLNGTEPKPHGEFNVFIEAPRHRTQNSLDGVFEGPVKLEKAQAPPSVPKEGPSGSNQRNRGISGSSGFRVDGRGAPQDDLDRMGVRYMNHQTLGDCAIYSQPATVCLVIAWVPKTGAVVEHPH